MNDAAKYVSITKILTPFFLCESPYINKISRDTAQYVCQITKHEPIFLVLSPLILIKSWSSFQSTFSLDRIHMIFINYFAYIRAPNVRLQVLWLARKFEKYKLYVFCLWDLLKSFLSPEFQISVLSLLSLIWIHTILLWYCKQWKMKITRWERNTSCFH